MRYCPNCATPLAHGPPVTCPACGARHWRNAKPCAGALVTRDGELLLVRRATEPWQGRWDIPGGFCEYDEHPAEAARREVREEAGVDIEITGFLGIWLDGYPDPHGDGVVTMNTYYHATATATDSPADHDPEEVIEVGWFPPDELPVEVAFPEHAVAVLDAWKQALADGTTSTPRYDPV